MTRRGRKREQASRTREELFDPVTGLVPWVTPRQVEYWIERGWIIPADPPSQGHPRVFSATEKRVLAVLARLVRAGLPAALAARVAREAVAQAQRYPRDRVRGVRLDEGIWLSLEDI